MDGPWGHYANKEITAYYIRQLICRVRQRRQINTIRYHLYVESKKVKFIETIEKSLPESGGG